MQALISCCRLSAVCWLMLMQMWTSSGPGSQRGRTRRPVAGFDPTCGASRPFFDGLSGCQQTEGRLWPRRHVSHSTWLVVTIGAANQFARCMWDALIGVRLKRERSVSGVRCRVSSMCVRRDMERVVVDLQLYPHHVFLTIAHVITSLTNVLHTADDAARYLRHCSPLFSRESFFL